MFFVSVNLATAWLFMCLAKLSTRDAKRFV